MHFETISVSVDRRGVASLTLRRHAQHNALSGLMIRELTAAAGLLAGDRAVRLVVLTGEGDSFCAGGDLNWMKEQVAATREAGVASGGGAGPRPRMSSSRAATGLPPRGRPS